jgi:hypothetical protein
MRYRDLAIAVVAWAIAGVISDAVHMERFVAGVFIAGVTLSVLLIYWRWEDAKS